MAVQALPKTGFELWQDGINKAVGDAKWNAWDCEIQVAVNERTTATFLVKKAAI
ncbi:hypothetical protein [Acetobacter papayae]|uniref:hypothetical protein n=1 Tax=Acetobacter papayae TaxID=1076592 RepID=UPI000AC435F8|nr:hypothetical protein [Acetobacter papayae]